MLRIKQLWVYRTLWAIWVGVISLTMHNWKLHVFLQWFSCAMLSYKTPVTLPRIGPRIALGFLIWKIVSDLRIIFFIRELILNVRNVLVASVMDAVCPQVRYGKIKLLDFSVKFLWILSLINIRNSSVTRP